MPTPDETMPGAAGIFPMLAHGFATLPPALTDAVAEQWQTINQWWPISGHTAPKPPWARRSFDHSGADAWRRLCADLPARPSGKPISAYFHIPFCESRCGFCDLYSKPLPRTRPEREARFIHSLCSEMEAWASHARLRESRVTTVHFGGGTPNFLLHSSLRRIVETFRSGFGVTPATEWALESTSRLLTDEHLGDLRALGFSRIHVGVQTLQDSIRLRIGRKEPAETVLQRLARAVEQGFIVSADVLYGLPGQRFEHLLDTLERLVDVGIEGVSLYQLQRTPRNCRFLDRNQFRAFPSLVNYAFFLAGEFFLRERGYRKTFFSHFSRPRDRNLYYSHVTRGEDLLALGPTADGVFADYIYRHPELGGYETRMAPALEGGMQESAWEQQIRPAVAALMNAVVPARMLADLGGGSLCDFWMACGALEQGENPGEHVLTANGSWFIARMIAQLHALGSASPSN